MTIRSGHEYENWNDAPDRDLTNRNRRHLSDRRRLHRMDQLGPLHWDLLGRLFSMPLYSVS